VGGKAKITLKFPDDRNLTELFCEISMISQTRKNVAFVEVRGHEDVEVPQSLPH
jgi:hypothetical protein